MRERLENRKSIEQDSFVDLSCFSITILNYFFDRIKLFPLCPSRQNLTFSACICVPIPQRARWYWWHLLGNSHLVSEEANPSVCWGWPLTASLAFNQLLPLPSLQMMHTLILTCLVSKGSFKMKQVVAGTQPGNDLGQPREFSMQFQLPCWNTEKRGLQF